MDPAASSDRDLPDQIASQLRSLLSDRNNVDLTSQLDGHLMDHPMQFADAINRIYKPLQSKTLPDSDTAKKIPAGEWANCIDNQHCVPREIRSASSLADLVSIVNEARGKGWTARIVGAGHSFSDVAITYNKGSKQEGILVKPDGLKGVTLSDGSLLREGVDASHLVVVESGTTIHELNEQLDKMKLGLINMGAYDHQTIAGAISTGTHGTGVSLGPMGSSVRSIVLVSETGDVYQVEPSDGITDAAKFNSVHRDRILMQDDDWFQSHVLAIGCMGLIFSYTLQVDTAYLLCENRKASEWSQVRDKIQVLSNGQIPSALTQYRHYEVDVNPYPILGQHFCIETTRYIPAPNVKPHGSRGFDNWISGLLAQLPVAQEALVWAFNEFPSLLIPKSITSGLSTLEDQDYVDKSFKVLDLGAVNDVPAYAIELSFDLVNAVANLDKLFDLFVKFTQPSQGGQPWWIAGPVGVRFVQSSDAYLAPQYGRVTCMAELDMLQGINHGDDLLKAIQREMTADTTVRVHWGLELDTLNGPQVKKMYPRYNRWLNIYRQMNTTGVFNSPFTDRLGITVNVDRVTETTKRNSRCIPC